MFVVNSSYFPLLYIIFTKFLRRNLFDEIGPRKYRNNNTIWKDGNTLATLQQQYKCNYSKFSATDAHFSFNFVRVAEPQVWKNCDGQDSASNAPPPLSTHQLLTQSARQENRRHQTRHAYPSNAESKHPLLSLLSGSNISVPIPKLVRQMHLEKQVIGKPLQAKCISFRTHINLLNSRDRVTNDRALIILYVIRG